MRTTEQKNAIIAEFMGWKKGHPELFELRWSDEWFNDKEKMTTKGYLHFDTSWDWLMPVVEKIERLGFTIEKNFQPVDNDWQCLVVKGNDILFQEFNEQSIQAMHYVVSEFIEMYNNKNK
jgi:hypothetical protein